MPSDDVQKSGEHCLREGKRCEPEDKNLSMINEFNMCFGESLLQYKFLQFLIDLGFNSLNVNMATEGASAPPAYEAPPTWGNTTDPQPPVEASAPSFVVFFSRY